MKTESWLNHTLVHVQGPKLSSVSSRRWTDSDAQRSPLQQIFCRRMASGYGFVPPGAVVAVITWVGTSIHPSTMYPTNIRAGHVWIV